MSRLSEVLTTAVVLMVLMQVYLHHIDKSSTGLQSADFGNSIPTNHEQLIITLNATLQALRSELGGVVSLHKQVEAHALEEEKLSKSFGIIVAKTNTDAERNKASLCVNNLSQKSKEI